MLLANRVKKEKSRERVFPLRIREIHSESPDGLRVLFDPPGRDFFYEPGQFLSLLISLDGKIYRRCYSFYTTPKEKYPGIVVRRVRGGQISGHIHSTWKVGDTVNSLIPMGSFTLSKISEIPKNVLLWAGGAGITPLFSLAQHLLHEYPTTQLHLVYANRSEEYTLLRSLSKVLEKKYPEKLRVTHFLENPPSSWKGQIGRIKAHDIKTILQSTPDVLHFLCGPPPMMKLIEENLKSQGVPPSRIRKESFEAGETSPMDIIDPAQQSPHEVHIVFQGESHLITVQPHESILEAALAQDIPLPHSCTKGLCTSCKCRILQGKLGMKKQEALSEEEIQEGYRLSCIGYPLSEDLKIEIDSD
ncbi:MAG: iron-sulfur cluster-binding domain-containing protein [Cytophagales bacterium]|nr:iron-sulfur cluster-binding domain-containing protein [Cytophagales bacterium]